MTSMILIPELLGNHVCFLCGVLRTFPLINLMLLLDKSAQAEFMDPQQKALSRVAGKLVNYRDKPKKLNGSSHAWFSPGYYP